MKLKDRLLLLDRTQQGILTVLLTVVGVVVLYLIIAPLVIELPRDMDPRLLYTPLYMYFLPIMAFGFAGTGIVLYIRETSEFGIGLLKGVFFVFVGGTIGILVILLLFNVFAVILGILFW